MEAALHLSLIILALTAASMFVAITIDILRNSDQPIKGPVSDVEMQKNAELYVKALVEKWKS